MKLLCGIMALLNVFINCCQTHPSIHDGTIDHVMPLFSNMYDGYKIKRIAGQYVLGKTRKKHKDIICIKKYNSPDTHHTASHITVLTGGDDGFVWTIKNTLCTFDTTQERLLQWKIPDRYNLFDVIIAKQKAYLYCSTQEKNEFLVEYDLITETSIEHQVKPRKECLILEDQYCRYVTTDSKYSLIEALPYYSPSLLISNFPSRETLGIFKSQYSDKHIAMSHNLRQYVVYKAERFQHYNYENQENTLYDLDKVLFDRIQLKKILFTATDDLLILQGGKKIILISFEEMQHWQINLSKKIVRIFPHVISGKTIIQCTGGNFGYLDYDIKNDAFKIIPM